MKFKFPFWNVASAVLLFTAAAPVNAQYNTLKIPDTLSGNTFNLKLIDTFTQLRPGNQTITSGINSNFWGPTLFVNKGETVYMNVHNTLNDSTTIHWHGFHLPAVMDGGPHQIIPPNSYWRPYWKMKNNAGTYWYHPHLHEMTQEHLTKGLGGLIIVRDSQESSLPLPRTYGSDDIPLVLTSRRYSTSNQFVFEDVAYGDYLLVNGTSEAEVTVPKQVIRLRILNAETERGFNLGFSDNRKFYVICNDGGLLDKPVEVTRLPIFVGERYEILVDLSGETVGKTFDLKAYNTGQSNSFPGGENQTSGAFGSLLNNKDFNILHFNVAAATAKAITQIPTALVTNTYLTEQDATNSRTVTVTNGLPGNNPFRFDNKLYDYDFINHKVPVNTTEKWSVKNNEVFGHAFHIHDVQFKITSRSSGSIAAYESGWKDVFFMSRNETVTFVARFSDYADPEHPFMYHCHFTNHEDAGMMAQFTVVDNSSNTTNTEKFSFKLFPNPASKRLYLTLDQPNTSVYYVRIFNLSGKVVMMLPQPQLGQGIDISDLPAGIYSLQVTDKQTKSTSNQKFTVL